MRAGTRKFNIGGDVLRGLRICLAPDSRSKPRGEIVRFPPFATADSPQIVKLGGQVVLHADTAVTHVIEDSGASAALLARRLGLQSLSDLPEGTVIVKWDWVTQCKFEVSIPAHGSS